MCKPYILLLEHPARATDFGSLGAHMAWHVPPDAARIPTVLNGDSKYYDAYEDGCCPGAAVG